LKLDSKRAVHAPQLCPRSFLIRTSEFATKKTDSRRLVRKSKVNREDADNRA
jgi:hypothetical protein